MARFVYMLCVAALSVFISCTSKTPPKSGPVQPNDDCSCYGPEADISSKNVFEMTSALWARNFVWYFTDADSSVTWFAMKIHADTLLRYLNERDTAYAGMRLYYALDTGPVPKKQTGRHMKLIMVPYVADSADPVPTDTTFDNMSRPYVQLDTSGAIVGLNAGRAEQMISFWAHHYDTLDQILVPVTSVLAPREVLMEHIDSAYAANRDSFVYFTVATHTIDPENTDYCVTNAAAHVACADCFGYAVFSIIISASKTNATQDHSSDFLRPCPRYCGKPKFPSFLADDPVRYQNCF